MRVLSVIVVFVLSVSPGGAQQEKPLSEAATYLADGFDIPVGKPDGEGYYKARGYRPNGHLGEDWNGKNGGDSDLGAAVYSIAHGVVLFAQDFGHGWGNVVIVRHVFEEEGQRKVIDSLYGHLDQIHTRYGVHVKRGQQIGTIGTGGGRYPAHLHFEIRRDLRVGMARHRFPRDDRTYYNPTEFILARRQLPRSAATAMVPVNTFAQFNITASAVDDSDDQPQGFVVPSGTTSPPAKKDWKPNRYDDLKR